jgi:hypothetical protein
VADEEARKVAFSDAVEAIREGRFDAIKAAMEALGFVFRQTGDPNHWVYFQAAQGRPAFSLPPKLLSPSRGAAEFRSHL